MSHLGPVGATRFGDAWTTFSQDLKSALLKVEAKLTSMPSSPLDPVAPLTIS